MTHRECGGELIKDPDSPPYQDHVGSAVPVIRCSRCGNEILGDVEIQFTGEDAHLEEEPPCP